MNKNLFRIIFNKRRRQLMAVAESTASQGKVAGGETPASAGADASDQADLALGALSLAMLCALGGVLWALPMPRAHAQVVAYRNAPGNQQPTILQTANGVPQINIQSPSAAGVSRNVYSQFDVQSKGVILNNSRTNALTQQGGWVQANPWLATGSARVILNEVNATNPSQLNGYVEVGGQRAEVVIANPAGISVNGGGFVNTSKAILTTGTPVLNSGRLDGYRVQGGAISIHGNGLDLSTTDYAALLARAVQVNAGIWANELKVVTGANAIDAASLSANTSPVASPIAGTGAVPSFALDVAQLGGMYAGKIHLIGTELGLGVRSAGVLSSMGSAAAGDLVLQNNGWLTNTGAIQAGANLLITTEGGITNSGAIAAQGNTKITANSLSSNAAGLVAAGIQSNGSLIAPVTASLGNLDIATTQGIAVNGQTLAANTVTYTGSSVDLSGSQTSAAHITVTANSGNVTTSNATLATFGSAGVLAITAKANNAQTLDNAQGVLSAGRLNLEVANFSNIQGQALQTGTGDTAIVLTSPTSTFNNTGGTVAVNSSNFDIKANTLINTDGKIQHAGTGTFNITADSLNNLRGQVASNNHAHLTIATQLNNTDGVIAAANDLGVSAGASFNNTRGLIQATAGNLNVSTANFDNIQGSVYAQQDLSLVATGVITNTGFIAAQGNATLSANSLSSSSTGVLGAGVKADGTLTHSGDLQITTTQALNANGQNLAAGNVTLSGSSVNLSGSQTAGANIGITATSDTLNTTSASVVTPGTLRITAKANDNQVLNNTQGVLSAGELNLDVTSLNNTQGQVSALRDLTITAGRVDNGGGTIAARQSANLQTGALNNNGGLIQTGGDLIIYTHGQTLTNTHAAAYTSSTANLNGKGGIAAQGALTLNTGDLNNDAGYIGSKGVFTANSTSISNSNTNGTGLGIEGFDVRLSTHTLRNDSGVIRADRDITITSAGVINNQTGLMSAGNALTLQDLQTPAHRTLDITNTNATLLAGQELNVSSNSIGGDGSILSKGNLNLALNTDFANTGQIIANGNTTLETSANLTNSGKLQAGNTLNLAANHFDNTARGEVSGNTTQLNVTRTLTNRGLIDGLDTQVNAETVNNIGTGRIYGDHLSVAAVNLLNDTETLHGVTQAATLAARDRLDLGVSGTVTNREHALIYSEGDMAIGGTLDAARRATGSATTLNNNSATIEAGRHLDLASATVNNTNDHFTTRIDQVAGPTAKNWLVGQWHVDHETSTYNTVVNEYETKVASSDPAQILAGGNILIRGQNLTNDKSKIIAGGSLTGDLVNLNNIQAVGEHRLTESGEVTVTTHHWSGGWLGRGNYWTSLTTDYNPADVVTSITLPVTFVLDNTSPTATGSAISRWVNGSVNNVLDTVGSVQARSANVSVQPAGAAPMTAGLGVSGSSSAAARQAANQTLSVRGAHPNTTLPTSSLFKTNPSLTSAYLVETDPRFIDRKTWLGSDYITQSIGLDPTVTQKRLGDGYYEQKLIREQVAELTGRRYLADYTSDEQEYKALMNSAITFAQTYNLRPGIALTAQQMAQLTSDIVWLVEQTVSLPDGSSQKVLVPQLYVKVQPGDIDASGALLAGKEVNLRLTGDLTNSGTIAALGNVAGRNVVSLTAANVNNLGGRIGGDDVSVTAQRDLNNIGGSIAAVNSLKAVAGRDLTVQTTMQSAVNAMASRTRIDRVAGLYVSGSGGTLLASAGRDLSVVAGVVSNAGNGSTLLGAGNNLTLAAAKTSQQLNIVWDANNYSKSSSSTDVGSTVTGGGNTQLNAGQTILATAANVQAAGALGVTAANINLQAGQATQASDEARKSTSKGVMSSTTVVTKDTRSSVTAVGSNLGGDTVALLAGQDITLKGSNVVSDNGTQLAAGGNVNIQAAQNTNTSSSFRNETSSGLMSGGGLSISFGKQQQSLDDKATTTTAAASTVGSVAGNVAITAGNQYQQVGSDVLAPQGNIDITAKAVTIQEARETNAQSTEQKFEQSGVTLALNSAVISTVQNAQNQLKAATQTSDARMKTLASASAAANLKMAADALKGTEIASANAADKVGGISLSLGYGQSSSQSRQNAQSDTARGSTVQAGGQVNIAAIGGGERSNLIVQGSDISGQQVSLAADQQVAFLAASNNSSQSNSSSNKSASVGVAAQLGNSGGGMGVTGSISAGSGSGSGADTVYTNTHITGTDSVRIKSGGDTTLKGATVVGKQVTAAVGGNLNI